MKNHPTKFILAILLAVLTVLPGASYALQVTDRKDIFDGHLERFVNFTFRYRNIFMVSINW